MRDTTNWEPNLLFLEFKNIKPIFSNTATVGTILNKQIQKKKKLLKKI